MAPVFQVCLSSICLALIVQSCIRLFVTTWTAAHQAPLQHTSVLHYLLEVAQIHVH